MVIISSKKYRNKKSINDNKIDILDGGTVVDSFDGIILVGAD